MARPFITIAALLCGLALAAFGLVSAFGQDETGAPRSIVLEDRYGDVLTSVPLQGDTFAVSYRNSLYHTMAEERYRVLPDGSYRLVQIAADQLAVLEEYYGVPGAPVRADDDDRREWVVPPDPTRPAVFENLSIAATDLGERTLHVPGEPPLEMWRLLGAYKPFIALDVKENQ